MFANFPKISIKYECVLPHSGSKENKKRAKQTCLLGTEFNNISENYSTFSSKKLDFFVFGGELQQRKASDMKVLLDLS